jgi:hypothetical protein
MTSVHDIAVRSSISLQRRRIKEMCVARQMLFMRCAIATLAFESDSPLEKNRTVQFLRVLTSGNLHPKDSRDEQAALFH